MPRCDDCGDEFEASDLTPCKDVFYMLDKIIGPAANLCPTCFDEWEARVLEREADRLARARRDRDEWNGYGPDVF